LEVLEDMRERNCRVFSHFGDYHWVEGVLMVQYEMGSYGGRFLQLVTEWLANWVPLNMYGDPDERERHEKISQVLRGAIGVSTPRRVGPYGEKIKDDFEALFPGRRETFTCYGFDAGLLLGHIIEDMNQYGREIYRGDSFMESLRRQNFLGATGVFKLRDQADYREFFGYGVFNFQDTVESFIQVGRYDPYSESIVELDVNENPIIWPDGSKNLLYIEEDRYETCPFYSEEVEHDPLRSPYLLPISIAIWLSVALISFRVGWKLSSSIYPMERERLITIFDGIVFLGLLIEFFYMFGFTPKFESSQNSFREEIRRGVLTDNTDITFKEKFFFSAIFVIAYLVQTVVFSFSDLYYGRSIGAYQFGNSLPFTCSFLLSFSGFEWLIGNLMEVNNCSTNVTYRGDTTRYFAQDCSIECNSSEGDLYRRIGNLLLLLYVPIATYHRLQFQNLTSFKIFRQSLKFLTLKTVGYLLLTLSNPFLEKTPYWHSFANILTIGGLFIYCWVERNCVSAQGPRIFHLGWYIVILLDLTVMLMLSLFDYTGDLDLWLVLMIIFATLVIGYTIYQMKHGVRMMASHRAPTVKFDRILRFLFARKSFKPSQVRQEAAMGVLFGVKDYKRTLTQVSLGSESVGVPTTCKHKHFETAVSEEHSFEHSHRELNVGRNLPTECHGLIETHSLNVLPNLNLHDEPNPNTKSFCL